MSVRDDLLRACATGDELTLSGHGWRPVFDALTSWWPKQFGRVDLRPYVSLLADESPDAIVTALRKHTTTKGGGYRPSPAEVRALIHADDAAAPRTGGDSNPAEAPDVLARVAAAIRAGEVSCECPGPTSRTWLIDPPPTEDRSNPNRIHRGPPRGIWRCPDCRGIEQSQVWAAEDWIAEGDA